MLAAALLTTLSRTILRIALLLLAGLLLSVLLLAGFLAGLIALLLLTRILVGILILTHFISFQRWTSDAPRRTFNKRGAIAFGSARASSNTAGTGP